jgi:hypothetical protein
MHGTQKQNNAVRTYLPTDEPTKPNHQSTINPNPKQKPTTKGWAILLHIIAFKWLMLS